MPKQKTISVLFSETFQTIYPAVNIGFLKYTGAEVGDTITFAPQIADYIEWKSTVSDVNPANYSLSITVDSMFYEKQVEPDVLHPVSDPSAYISVNGLVMTLDVFPSDWSAYEFEYSVIITHTPTGKTGTLDPRGKGER